MDIIIVIPPTKNILIGLLEGIIIIEINIKKVSNTPIPSVTCSRLVSVYIKKKSFQRSPTGGIAKESRLNQKVNQKFLNAIYKFLLRPIQIKVRD